MVPFSIEQINWTKKLWAMTIDNMGRGQCLKPNYLFSDSISESGKVKFKELVQLENKIVIDKQISKYDDRRV